MNKILIENLQKVYDLSKAYTDSMRSAHNAAIDFKKAEDALLDAEMTIIATTPADKLGSNEKARTAAVHVATQTERANARQLEGRHRLAILKRDIAYREFSTHLAVCEQLGIAINLPEMQLDLPKPVGTDA